MPAARKSNLIVVSLILLILGTGLIRLGLRLSRRGEQGAGGAEIIELPKGDRKPVPEKYSAFIPAGTVCESKADPFVHLELTDAKGGFLGVIAESATLAPEAGSYESYSQEPVNVGVVISEQKKILGVLILNIHDTPEFVQTLHEENFLDRLKGVSGETILKTDTVSGATMSSSSVLSAVHQTWEKVSDYLSKTRD